MTVDRPVLGRPRARAAQVSRPRPRGRHAAPDAAQTPRPPRRRSHGLVDPDLRWSDIERFAAEQRAAGPGQGHPHRRGRRAGRRSRGRRAWSSPTTAAASSTRSCPAPTRCPRSSTPSADASTCSSTAASGAGTDVVKALALGARAVLHRPAGDCGAWRWPARAAPSMCWRRCWASSTTRWRWSGCPAPPTSIASFVAPAPWAGRRSASDRPGHRDHRLRRRRSSPRAWRATAIDVRGFARSPERVALDVPVVAGDAVSGEGLPRRSTASTSPTS